MIQVVWFRHTVGDTAGYFKANNRKIRSDVLKLPIFSNFRMFERSEIFGMFGLKMSESAGFTG